MGFLTVIHIIVCLLLIALVLLQDSKGAMGNMYGGSASSSLLGPTGAPNFLAKLTRWCAIVFAVICIVLSKITAEKEKSALDTLIPPSIPTNSAPVAPEAPKTDHAPTGKSTNP